VIESTVIAATPRGGSYCAPLGGPDDAARMLAGRRLLALTGAGLSTDSGIPDYRGPGSPPRAPMTYDEFVSGPRAQQRYWARSHLGWRRIGLARPNAGHRALAALQRSGVVTELITQNVDGLHRQAGSQPVIDLHGRIAEVICLDCGGVTDRSRLHERLSELNPTFGRSPAKSTGGRSPAKSTGGRSPAKSTGGRSPAMSAGGRSPAVATAPDGDADLEDTEGFQLAGCEGCGGRLKPHVVLFGENVPRERVQRCYRAVDEAEALLVAGSSLTVMSGLRFVRHAARRTIPVVIVNRGITRGDPLAAVHVDAGCTEVLTRLADRLS